MKKKLSTIELSVQDLRTKPKDKLIKRVVKDDEIDYSDIPKFSQKQLVKFKRPGRPIVGDTPRKAISIRIEESVLDKLKARAKKHGIAYQSLINEILKKAV